jgi:3-oxoacyl-[acyl-carrier-protein] synthase III
MLSIISMGWNHPTNFIDNAFIEDLNIGTSSEWIEEKIGVKTRVTSLTNDYITNTRNGMPVNAKNVASTNTEILGTNAALHAIKNANLEAKDIGLVICNSCAPCKTIPSLSQVIAGNLGCSNVKSYDVTSACPAFALHMHYLNLFEEDALPEYILCIAASATTQHVNYNDRSDAAIWGDGSGAWIVSPRKYGKLQVLTTFFDADPTRCRAVVIDRYGHFHQDGRAVRDFSVRQTVRIIKRIEEEFAIDWNSDIFIGHQANRTMLDQICRNRKIPESNHWHNVELYGNQAGSGAAIVLAQNWDKLIVGQKIVIAVVGAGLSWGMTVFEVKG